jgi:hypothetical protein
MFFAFVSNKFSNSSEVLFGDKDGFLMEILLCRVCDLLGIPVRGGGFLTESLLLLVVLANMVLNFLGELDGGKVERGLLTESLLLLAVLANMVLNFLGVPVGGKVERGLLTESLLLILFVFVIDRELTLTF